MTDQYIDLLHALRDATNKKGGFECRIILRNEPDARLMEENLQAMDFDISKIKFQNNCHNKGIVIDSDILVVGSHNYSNSGVQFNRDASLIFFDEEVNEYFASVFDHDWKFLATSLVPENSVHPASSGDEGLVAAASQPTLASIFD